MKYCKISRAEYRKKICRFFLMCFCFLGQSDLASAFATPYGNIPDVQELKILFKSGYREKEKRKFSEISRAQLIISSGEITLKYFNGKTLTLACQRILPSQKIITRLIDTNFYSHSMESKRIIYKAFLLAFSGDLFALSVDKENYLYIYAVSWKTDLNAIVFRIADIPDITGILSFFIKLPSELDRQVIVSITGPSESNEYKWIEEVVPDISTVEELEEPEEPPEVSTISSVID